MARRLHFFILVFLQILANAELPPSQIQSLLRLPKLLEYPSSLSPMANGNVDFCNIPPSPNLTISCDASRTSINSLQITGDRASSIHNRLSDAFSMETLGNILSTFQDLENLTLAGTGIWGDIPGKIDHLLRLRSLDLSYNGISGKIPQRLNRLLNLESLNLASNLITGNIPTWISSFPRLRYVDFSHNNLTGTIPASLFTIATLEKLSLSHNGVTGGLPGVTMVKATSLRYLNAGANRIGPKFPAGFPPNLEYLLMGQNEITGVIPSTITLSHAKVVDFAYNRLSGVPPMVIFRLPLVETLALNGNDLSGVLPSNLTFSTSLRSLDVSSNLFTGNPPRAFLTNVTMVRFDKNCMSTTVQRQYVKAHCEHLLARKQAAAAAAMAKNSQGKEPVADSHDMALIAGIIGGGIALVGAITVFLMVLIRCLKQQEQEAKQQNFAPTPSSCADTASLGVPSDLLSNARLLSQSIRFGVLGPPHNRVFSVPELEEMTGNFSLAAVIGEGQHGKVYKGKLQDGTLVAVKCVTLDAKQDMRQLKSHVELLIKVRHRHLVSYFGYGLERESESRATPQLFLVSEYINNGTLRNHLSRNDGKELLTWPQRLACVIGAGRGIQFLHTGVVPGILNNDVNITNVLMDQNNVAKLTDFGLGRHARTSSDFDAKLYVQKTAAHIDLDHHRRKLASDKTDVYNFGFILLETVLGRAPTIDKAVPPKIRELEMLMVENVPKFEVIDSSIVGTCVTESLNTVLEIAAKCLSEEAARPSMEDVLWNLQYAAQVQDRVSGEYTDDLPYVSPPRSRFNRQAIRASSGSGGRNSSNSGEESLKSGFLR